MTSRPKFQVGYEPRLSKWRGDSKEFKTLEVRLWIRYLYSNGEVDNFWNAIGHIEWSTEMDNIIKQYQNPQPDHDYHPRLWWGMEVQHSYRAKQPWLIDLMTKLVVKMLRAGGMKGSIYELQEPMPHRIAFPKSWLRVVKDPRLSEVVPYDELAPEEFTGWKDIFTNRFDREDTKLKVLALNEDVARKLLVEKYAKEYPHAMTKWIESGLKVVPFTPYSARFDKWQYRFEWDRIHDPEFLSNGHVNLQHDLDLDSTEEE